MRIREMADATRMPIPQVEEEASTGCGPVMKRFMKCRKSLLMMK